MLISVHLPKTAGTSFAKTLETVYGIKMLKDYSDAPLNNSPFKRKTLATILKLKTSLNTPSGIECIHGHFMPYKYSTLPKNTIFITWLRNPVERMASHYYFWKKNYNKATALKLHKRVVEEDWSLEKFAFSKELKNVYSTFFWKFPIERFSFIGISEHYEIDLLYLSDNILKTQLSCFNENVNKSKVELYITDRALRTDIETFHKKDMELYNWALKQRNR